jgi:hypothetical protein
VFDLHQLSAASAAYRASPLKNNNVTASGHVNLGVKYEPTMVRPASPVQSTPLDD